MIRRQAGEFTARQHPQTRSWHVFSICLDHDDFGLNQSKVIVIDSTLRAGCGAQNRATFTHPARAESMEIVMGLYSEMSADDLTVLKTWLLTRIEVVSAEEKVNGAARVKQLQDQLREVEAEIALKAKPN